MTRNTQSTNITSEQNNLVVVDQGGIDYWNRHVPEPLGYDFRTTGFIDNKVVADKFFEIGKKAAIRLSENKVVCLSIGWERLNNTVREVLCGVEPVYNENGLMQQFKNELIAQKRDNIVWSDYSWGEEKVIKSLIFRRPTIDRRYFRDICVVQDKLDISLVEIMKKASGESDGSIGICICPENEVIDKGSSEETIAYYVHRKDYVLRMSIVGSRAHIYMKSNPDYISFDEIMTVIKPIFEEDGFEFVNTENPYIKAYHCEGTCHNCNSFCENNFDESKYLYGRINLDCEKNLKTYEKWCEDNKSY